MAAAGQVQDHVSAAEARLKETIAYLRHDLTRVEEPQLKAIFETSAEVLGGIVKALDDYRAKSESAWQMRPR